MLKSERLEVIAAGIVEDLQAALAQAELLCAEWAA
jgi:hypothetical protein